MSNISIEKLDTKTFSRFGSVIQKRNALELRSINQGTTTRYHNISELSLESKNGNSGISIFSGAPRSFPIEIKIMEKHPVASQSFLPIQDYDWLIVVSEEKNELPDLDTLRCFHVNGDTGITYNQNVWHHPLLVKKKQDFWVIDRINDQEDSSINLKEYHFKNNETRFINL
ncbi:MAG: ureidoglycolate lyase [Alphaproteobacteria bacterium]|jgi:ureidoglycolate lyase|nr:ureidoglycolate lyase [Alphaproteobacteria bacterium]MBL6851217.1 ureidoglycolate lyase [Alphaproteobacteria bacterium]